MYRIGEFSKITNLSIKALRYYDKEKILIPSKRDSESSYRYYDENNFKTAQKVKMLRDLDFTINEIKDVISICEDDFDLSCILEEKKKQIKKNINDQKTLLNKINTFITPKLGKKNPMDYKIGFKTIPSTIVTSIRHKSQYNDCSQYINKLFKYGNKHAIGSPFNCYFDGEYKEIADIETCISIKQKINNQELSCKELPQFNAITTLHKGSYETLNQAYKALFKYAHENNLECLLPYREVYIKGPGMVFSGNPEKYITEIIIPINS